jgi:sugar lactone lactonase YvrE
MTLASTLALVGAAGAIFAPGIGATDKAPKVTVVAKGLNNPRGLAFANGRLYVAEAGVAGTDCPAGLKGPSGRQLCFGRTSDVAQIVNGKARPVLSNLISFAETPPPGLAAEGVEAVAPTKGGLLVVYGESAAGLLTAPGGKGLNTADSAAARKELGELALVSGGHQKILADVGDADFGWSAVHQNLVADQFPDANPNALLQVGKTTYVVDAASNTLDSVDSHGQVKQLAFFPNPVHSDAVPTCVALGPDGKLYLGQLAPEAPPNGGNIYRYSIATHKLTVWKTGFNVVDGCGFDKSGNFYAVELQTHGFNPIGNPAGAVIEVAPNGTRTTLGQGKLDFPQGFATDGAGNIYVSNWSILTGTGTPSGEVVKITP